MWQVWGSKNVFAGSYQIGEWRRRLYTRTLIIWCKSCFPGGSVVKNLPAKAGAPGDKSEIPGSGRSPGGENGNPLQYSCLGNPIDRGAWWAIVHWVTNSWMWLSTSCPLGLFLPILQSPQLSPTYIQDCKTLPNLYSLFKILALFFPWQDFMHPLRCISKITFYKDNILQKKTLLSKFPLVECFNICYLSG